MKARYAWLCAALVASGAALYDGAAQVSLHAQAAAGEIRVLPLRGNIYLLTGAGSNVVASVGKDGVMLVDTGAPAMADKVLAAVQDLSRRVTAAP